MVSGCEKASRILAASSSTTCDETGRGGSGTTPSSVKGGAGTDGFCSTFVRCCTALAATWVDFWLAVLD